MFGRPIGRVIMKTRYTVALSMIAGVAIGATAIQGLHAQASKARVLMISESEIVNSAAVPEYNTEVKRVLKAAGGDLSISDKVIAVLGTAPQRVGVTEFDSVDKAQAWVKSKEREALAPVREKAVKIVRQYIIEGH
jgi:uncharacterized protein (DUF1330 family)